MDINEILKQNAQITEKALENYLQPEKGCPDELLEAMKYAVLDGGKRIRPTLVFEFCKLCGGKTEAAIPFACAVEMIHSYSLIHDDLPCMDDDDTRRGKPSTHIAFGEANALLAGDALLSRAFEIMSECDIKLVKPQNIIRCINELAAASGMSGMVGGQVMDLEAENKKINHTELIELQKGKTGRMIMAAAVMGCIAADADEKKISAAREYAAGIGSAFQMIDDVLDVTADESELGKPTGSDKEQDKSTYVTLFGIEETMKMATALTRRAQKELKVFGENAEILNNLAETLLNRKK